MIATIIILAMAIIPVATIATTIIMGSKSIKHWI
jgi:hypothetical protein